MTVNCSKNYARVTGYLYAKKFNLKLYITPPTKIIVNWMKDQTLKRTYWKCFDSWVGRYFLEKDKA